MNKRILITGIAGHLGKNILLQLKEKGYEIRVFVHEESEEAEVKKIDPEVELLHGDVRNKDSLRPLFEGNENRETYLIHAASKVDIQHQRLTKDILDINVEGTKNIFSLAKEFGVIRSVYVSSVDSFKAIGKTIDETGAYADGKKEGAYALSKAMANNAVKEFQREGMDIRIVYPCGFFGPMDNGKNHLNQLLLSYLNGKLPGVIKASYTFADVRDITQGTLSTLFEGKRNGAYILGGEVVPLETFLREAGAFYPKAPTKITVFPHWLARIGVPFVKLHGKLTHQRPLYTGFALSLLAHANLFNDSKARKELSYSPRSVKDSMKDTIAYFEEQGLLQKK